MTRPPRGVLPAAVLWDMDGTIVDSEKLWDVSLRELIERLGGELTDHVREALVGSNLDHTIRVLLAESGRAATPGAIDEASRWLLDRTAVLFRDGLVFRPGALAALRAVRAAGVPTALVTSTERELTEVALNTIGRGFFDVSVCGDEVDGLNKPHPRPYQRAAELLGVDPAECVAVEDSVAGATSAAAAGCTVLVVPCDAPVPPGENRVLRDSLVGVDAEVLGDLLEPRAA